jgi:hypothetical protein
VYGSTPAHQYLPTHSSALPCSCLLFWLGAYFAWAKKAAKLKQVQRLLDIKIEQQKIDEKLGDLLWECGALKRETATEEENFWPWLDAIDTWIQRTAEFLADAGMHAESLNQPSLPTLAQGGTMTTLTLPNRVLYTRNKLDSCETILIRFSREQS